MMKILLVNPAIRPDSPKCILNVGLAYVASALEREGHELEILDIDAHRYSHRQIERKLAKTTFDAVGVGTLVSQYGWAKRIFSLLKRRNPHAPIVVGNTLGTSVPEILLQRTEADIAVLGEGEETACELFRVLEGGDRPQALEGVEGIVFKKDGQIVRTPRRPVIADVNTIPSPNYDLFEMDIYLERSKWMVPAPERLPIPFEQIVSMPVNTARGCPFSCTFCYHAFQKLKYRHRSPENVCDEIELWRDKYGANFICFWDELSFYQDKATERFADLMIERHPGVYFFGSCRSELINWENAHIADKLRRAGCKGLGYSLESGNEEILTAMNKHNHVSDFVTQTKVFHSLGIEVYTSLVFGYPQETKETIRETFKVCEEAHVYPSVGYLQPMPGTPMYDHALGTGAIDDEETYLMRMGDRQDLRVNLCESMSSEEMEAEVHAALTDLNKKLETGLGEQELFKTRMYRVSKAESFLDSFGVAAQVEKEQVAC